MELAERPLTVRGDPNRLAQVVGNLLSNAIKYSPDGGTVELVAARNGEGVRIAVRDEGRGIPTDQQSRIFTKFFRGDAGATGITGTGLGLAVSREIVEAHGGRIGFDTDPGEGTTFWLELPGTQRRSDDEGNEGGGKMSKRLGWLLVGAPPAFWSRRRGRALRRRVRARRRSGSTSAQLAVTRVDVGRRGTSPGDMEVVRSACFSVGRGT